MLTTIAARAQTPWAQAEPEPHVATLYRNLIEAVGEERSLEGYGPVQNTAAVAWGI